MHPSAMANAKVFFDTYFAGRQDALIVEIGSQDVNGSLRKVAPEGARYIGVDFQEAKGVDLVIEDPYVLPFPSETVDAVVSSSCFEHSEMFWLLFLEALRILRPSGILYLNVPSNGAFHRYPVDCWRFYPDAGLALARWARRSGINAVLLESYTSCQDIVEWNDYVAVFIKDEKHAADYPLRIVASRPELENCWVLGSEEIRNFQEIPQDRRSRQVETAGFHLAAAARLLLRLPKIRR